MGGEQGGRAVALGQRCRWQGSSAVQTGEGGVQGVWETHGPQSLPPHTPSPSPAPLQGQEAKSTHVENPGLSPHPAQ